MLHLINRSVKSIYHNFTQGKTHPIINYATIDYISFQNGEPVLVVILLIKSQVNIYSLQTDPIVNFNLIFMNEFNFYINKIEPIINLIKYKNEYPLIAIVSNSNLIGENEIKFYSIDKRNIINTMKIKSNIIHLCFRKKNFAISCLNGKIYIYSNTTMKLIYKISINGVKQIITKSESILIEKPNKENNKLSESVSLNSISTKELDEEKETQNCISIPKTQMRTTQSMMINKRKNSKEFSTYNYNISFDMSNCYISYHIMRKSEKEMQNSNCEGYETEFVNVSNTSNASNQTTLTTFESFALEVYKNLSKFKEWSIKSIKDLNNLRKSTQSKSYTDILSNSSHSSTYIYLFNYIGNHLHKIPIPFFKEGISIIKQIKNGKYLIVGNKNSQLFYLLELYPQTNYKYKNKQNEFKIIYSIFRGIRSCKLCGIDISRNNDYGIITSNRGTNHLFYLPERDNQINEEVREDNNSNNNKSANEEYLNMKIVNGEEIWKNSYNYYNVTNTFVKYASKIVCIDNIVIDNNFNSENSMKIKEMYKDKFTSYIKNGNYVVMLNDNIINISLIIDKKNIIPLKMIKLAINQESGNIKNNYDIVVKEISLLSKNKKMRMDNANGNSVILSNILLSLSEKNSCTNLSNFSIVQLNPMFTFNNYSLQKEKSSVNRAYLIEHVVQFSFIGNRYIIYTTNDNIKEEKEIYLYESLCDEMSYAKIKKFNDRKRKNDIINESINTKSIIINPSYEDTMNSIDIKMNFYNIKDDLLEYNIKNAMNSNIKDIFSDKSTVEHKEKLIIQEDYYK